MSFEELSAAKTKSESNGKNLIDKVLPALNNFLKSSIGKYLSSAAIVSLASVILFYLHLHIGYQAISLLFLFIISLLPLMNFGPGPIFLAAVMSAFIWNFFFIPPSFTLRIGKVEDVLMFVMYFIIASVSGLLITRIRTQQMLINQREKKTAALYNLAKELSSSKSLDDIVRCSIEQLKNIFGAETVFVFFETEKKLLPEAHEFSTFKMDQGEWNIAQWVFANSEKAGRFTNTMPITPAIYYPLKTKTLNLGVIGLVLPDTASLASESVSLLETFLSQISVALERDYLKESAKNTLLVTESQKLYKTLFDSISHELKTPVTTIIGAVSSLRDEKIIKNQSVLSRLVDETNIAADRLNRLVENLLDITRLESGNIIPKKEWHSVSDLINSAIARLKQESLNHEISFNVNEDVELVYFDFPLIEQALTNIIHNSIEYTPPYSRIEIFAKKFADNVMISVSDNGPGFPSNAIKNLFQKFYRVPGTKTGGTGLGLSIARGFIEAHGGSISAQNKSAGGAEFIILLPLK
jgi:two-component system sensor histidine kinase KdpD